MYKKRSSRGFSGNGFKKRRRGFGGRRRSRRGGSKLDVAALINKSQHQDQVNESEALVERSFEDFKLHPKLKKNIEELGFSSPTPIQDKVFDLVREGKDISGTAHTGTGKTAAFLIPLIDQALRDSESKILIVAPTRELALQINEAFINLVRGTSLFTVSCIGGTRMHNQIRQLERKHHAVIGTPGRLLDLGKRRKIIFSQFKAVVLDEVDRMLDMGFVNDIRKILKQTPKERQSLFFSATISRKVSQLVEEFSQELTPITVKNNITTDLISQKVVSYENQEGKLQKLHDILSSEEVSKAVVFGRTKIGVKKLMFKLREKGFRTDSIHGNKNQSQRQKALNDFRKNKVNVLVATDVASRGLDIDDVSHVINYELPDNYDDYIHRIGRTGRGGKQGTAYTFVQ